MTEPEQIDMTPLPDNSVRDIAGLRAYLVAASEILEAKLPARHKIIGNKRKTFVAIAQSRIVAFHEVVAMIDTMNTDAQITALNSQIDLLTEIKSALNADNLESSLSLSDAREFLSRYLQLHNEALSEGRLNILKEIQKPFTEEVQPWARGVCGNDPV